MLCGIIFIHNYYVDNTIITVHIIETLHFIHCKVILDDQCCHNMASNIC